MLEYCVLEKIDEIKGNIYLLEVNNRSTKKGVKYVQS